MKLFISAVVITLAFSATLSRAEESVWLSSLDLGKVQQGWGSARADKSVQEKPISIAGQKFEHGVGTHAVSVIYVNVGGKAEQFTAFAGVDDEIGVNPGSVEFHVIADGKTLWKSGVMTASKPAAKVLVDLRGVKTMVLLVTGGSDSISFDHADWADAKIDMSEGKPQIVARPAEEGVFLTPKPGPAPRINGPKVYGGRPGHPFLYRIPCTGVRPIEFSAVGLPASLKLDSATGVITGVVPELGDYMIRFTAKNEHGQSERVFKLVAGDKLSLTPQMGFNDWYAYTGRITDKDMRTAADTMIASGMADAGYQYVNVDGCWQGPRDAAGNIAGNARFPDMKALADYIHTKGLKAGLYASPGPADCAGFTGTFGHEAQDAKQFADWGFDFLKYDWCSYKAEMPGVEGYKKPYLLMGGLLRQQNRDIVFNLCQYGMGDVWNWGAEVGGQSWRTAGDIIEEFNHPFEIALRNCAIGQHNKPGEYNDPDYLQIGWIGNDAVMKQASPVSLTPNESYTHMSLWCLMSSPLFYSGNMTKLNEFTVNVLCNPEVIEVDQDPLGQCAKVIGKPGSTFVLAKEMEDGSKAVGLCNRGEFETTVAVNWSDLGLTGEHNVRDLWRQKDLGKCTGKLEATVPRHGVVLVRIGSVQ